MKSFVCLLSLLLISCANESQSAEEQQYNYILNAPLYHCVYGNGVACEESIGSEGVRGAGKCVEWYSPDSVLGEGPCPRTNCVGVCQFYDFYSSKSGKWKKVFYQGDYSGNRDHCWDTSSDPDYPEKYSTDC